MNIKEQQREFEKLFADNIISKIPQAKALLDYIKSTDFFTAPASTTCHSNYAGGLCEHSINVYYRLKNEVSEYMTAALNSGERLLLEDIKDSDLEDILGANKAEICLAALCHDLCKCNTYILDKRSVKTVENGRTVWVEKPFYKKQESFVMGHGMKSLYIVMTFVQGLSLATATAIRYHMGGFEQYGSVDSQSSQAFITQPLSLLLHIADMKATFIDEEIIN